VALVPLEMSSVRVGSSVNIKASVSEISQVSYRSSEPSDVLELSSTSEWSGDGSVVVVVPVVTVVLNRHDQVSVGSGSDRSSSPVEGPPLLDIIWSVVLDSESVLTVADVLSPDNSLTRAHS